MTDKKDNSLGQAMSVKSHKDGFLSGSHIAFVFKKIERLSSAIYLLSDLWNDKEPLKWTLRGRNLNILEEASRYHYSSFSHRENIGSVITARIAEIVSLLEISFASGLLSEMNLRVLREEYVYLINLIKEKETASITLPKSFFETDSESDLLPNRERDIRLSSGSEAGESKGHKGQVSQNNVSFRKPSTPQAAPKTPKQSSEKKTNDRRELIIQLVRARGEITIKDAIAVIKGYSEKTIQRELIAMTNAGVLKKQGERRWSRYSVA